MNSVTLKRVTKVDYSYHMHHLMASDGIKGVVIGMSLRSHSFIVSFIFPFFFVTVVVQVHWCVFFKISHFLMIVFKIIIGENYDFYKTVIFTIIFYIYIRKEKHPLFFRNSLNVSSVIASKAKAFIH